MTIIFATAADQARAFTPASILAEAAEGEPTAVALAAYDVATFERLWAKTDQELVEELREVRAAQDRLIEVSDDGFGVDWDAYDGWDLQRDWIYAVQNNREAIADAAYEATLVGAATEGLTHRPFSTLV
ncbi:hypothetical protein SEA_PUPPER_205 [Gordonia phage Pupper]|uniref:Uncharacterized protein n=1 Tax=Gordonia phage Pupper TaxID=2571249 RepID=A0A4Y6EMQ5_9CAUD|nr:hypothetical protein KHQ83_gp072 [Gordonia phage Pupper]QDF18691.1 hypothetical protein SEA_PUPPER_205 [Gordonia phage Pupper]QDF18923.1 hypothetical protein SEA_SCENTAE_204 [Gordonia phage SCentae]